MRTKMIISMFMISLLLLSGATLMADADEEITGRVVVERGTVGTLTGTLAADGDEWVLMAGSRLYEIHLGQFGHDGKTTATLIEGAEAVVEGFIYGDHVSPVMMESEGLSYRFRDQDGRPLWAGMRLGPYAEDRQDLDRPAGDRPGWGRNSEVKSEVQPVERGGRFTPPGTGRNRVGS
jgi:hypothetical protein